MTQGKVLIVDDDSSLLKALVRILELQGLQAYQASQILHADRYLREIPDFTLAIVDLQLPDGNGIDLLTKIKAQQPQCEVMILTGHASLDLAMESVRKGAFHFLKKPFNVDEMISLVNKAIDHNRLRAENNELKKELRGRFDFSNIIGTSEPLKKVLHLIERVSDSDSTLLITGESGTGKELIAKSIHYHSPRKAKPFVPINCGAIPADLLESELFGHVKGAFTGATQSRPGRFELAKGGTLFLDEIGDLSLNLQVKLLRVLQERRFEPVGSNRTIECDVRIIAATNVNLVEAIQAGRFREDLYYRLNVIPLPLPSLRERKEDIPLLLQYFIEKFNKTKNRNLAGIHRSALDLLCAYKWPGNVRELENLVERIAILKGEGLIEVEDLPEYIKEQAGPVLDDLKVNIPDSGMDFNSAVDAYENALILMALEKTGWNRNQAAILLKLNRTTLVEKIKKKGLRPPENFI
jgi:DNA-binding NtrC family response regulator